MVTPSWAGGCSCDSSRAVVNPTSIAEDDLAGLSLVSSVFSIPGMDYAAEEQLIHLRLADAAVNALYFDQPGRRHELVHAGIAMDMFTDVLANLGVIIAGLLVSLDCVSPAGLDHRSAAPDRSALNPEAALIRGHFDV